MKLLTLNTHSLQEENQEQKLEWFLEAVLTEKPDIIALQEVNQTVSAMGAEEWLKKGQYVVENRIPLRQDNYAAAAAYGLWQAGLECFWAWLPVKQGYGKHDEGVAIFSLGRKITNAVVFSVSRTNAYHNWRTRAVLGIQVDGKKDWFYTVHMGWWEDEEEPFSEQWDRLKKQLEKVSADAPVWLMGDFNAPDIFLNQNYTMICADGWKDMHLLAEQKGKDFTVFGRIDGWKDRLPDGKVNGMRLDYIFCSEEQEVLSSRIMFDGEKEPVVSDHFGVLIEIKEK
ncbi:MAG: endonuclease/exonuclease/phosphatase family protein [Anaerotignum sp.]|nr:endonuclease/exonuclease/phosphatase family protein [Anaerotignum sp.]